MNAYTSDSDSNITVHAMSLQFKLWLRLVSTDKTAFSQLLLVSGLSPGYFSAFGAPTLDRIIEKARSTSSRTDYELIRIFFRARKQFELKLNIPPANPPVRDRVNSVNAMLRNAAGDMRTRIHPDCRELITDLQEVTWKQGSANFDLDKVSDKKRTHLTDALGYMVCRVAPIDGFARVITPQN
jgi:hypothetical protein